jgi:hypothetical protein
LNQINKKGEQHMQRAMAVWLVAGTMALWCGLTPTYAQEESKATSEDNKPRAERPEKPVHAYRIDFSIHELEDGKKINTRHYSMDLNSGPWSEIKIGTRVPVSPTQGSFQYIDLGTSIDCQVGEQGEDVTLDIRSDFTNLSGPEEQHSAQPIIRQIKINGRTVTAPGKPVIIGAVDDPNSNRTFQLEATAARLK